MADTILFVLGVLITATTIAAVFLVGSMPRPDEPEPRGVPVDAPNERGGEGAAR